MLLLCIKIFFARLLDVSLATFRTMVLVKGQKVLPAILGFFEVLVWLMVVEETLKTETDSLWVPVSYAAGYAIGSLIGTWVSNKFIKSMCAVQVITDKTNTKLINAIKKAGYGISIIDLKKEPDTEKKEISQYLRNKDASLGNSGNGLSSILEIKEPEQKKKRSKADDDTRGR